MENNEFSDNKKAVKRDELLTRDCGAFLITSDSTATFMLSIIINRFICQRDSGLERITLFSTYKIVSSENRSCWGILFCANCQEHTQVCEHK